MMTNNFWQKIDEIFPQVADLPRGDKREAYLRELCGDDESLRQEISALLKGDEKAENFIESPVILPESLSQMFADATTEPQLSSRLEGQTIGAYRILRKIGAGGMGAIYLGERADGEFQKTVAVKFIKNGADTDFNLSRFRRERQILASLEHPHIARLLDGGTLPDGLPYLVMEYVEGENLLDFLRGREANLDESLRLFSQVLSAVEYAHSKGLIHRDLKPGNILVNREGKVKLLDFGIAKILDSDFIKDKQPQTATLMRQLTPEYSSPEQIKGELVTPASDIYCLGLILHELLSGSRVYQFNSRAPHEIARIICEEKISPPVLKLKASNTGDLNYIVLKALRKNPAERYASIREFNRDIERFLDGLPILSESERLKLFENSVDELGATSISLAIAPFQIAAANNKGGSSANKADDFLSVGLADALTTRLSGVRQLNLRPTGSVLRLAAEGKSALVLGKELSVDYVLEGTIQRSGGQIRVRVKLLETKAESVLRTEEFDESEIDIFRLQDVICERVAESLVPHLTTEEQKFLRIHGTASAEAYEAYLRGRVLYHTYTFAGIAQSGSFFEKAVQCDPNFALAHSGLADFYNWQAIAGLISNKEGFTKAKDAARRSIEIDPNLSEAQASLAFAVWAYDWDFVEAERLFLKSLRLNPNNSKAREWFSYLLSSDGRHDEAIEEMRRAERLDPNSPSLAAMFGFCLYNARRYAEGLEKTRRALELEPDYYLALQGLGWVCPPLGLHDEAIAGCRRAVSISSEMSFNSFSLALALIAAGERDEAREVASKIENKKLRDPKIPAYFLAEIYAYLEEFDLAFEWLDRAIKERGYWTVWVRVEPRFDNLRTDARFTARLARIKPFSETNKIAEDGITQLTDEISHQNITYKSKSLAIWATALATLILISVVIYLKPFQKSEIPADQTFNKTQSGSTQKIESSGENSQPDNHAAEIPLSTDEAANNFYRSGRQQLAVRTIAGTNKAIEFFNETIKRDPDFAQAFSGLSAAYVVLAGRTNNSSDAYRRAEEYAVKALTLNPDLAEAHASLGMTQFKLIKDSSAAEKHFLRAIEIDPKLATGHHWYGIVLCMAGKHEQSLYELEIAAQIEPESAIIQYALSNQYLELARLNEAEKAADKSIENNNAYTEAYVLKTLLQQYRGNYDAALETYRAARIYGNKDENEPLWLIMQAQTQASHHRNVEAEKFLNRYFQTADYRKNPLAHALDVALVYNLMNDSENTFSWLKKAAKTSDVEFMKRDLRFKNLHENSLFSAIFKNNR